MKEYAVGKFGGAPFRERVVERFKGRTTISDHVYEDCIRTETGLLFLPPSAGGFALSLAGNADTISTFKILDITRQRCYCTDVESK